MAKITKGGTAEAPTYTEEATNLIDDVVAGLTLPLAILDSDEVDFVSTKTAAVGALGWAGAAYALGARKPSMIPVLGVR